jgi:hypothetical protein
MLGIGIEWWLLYALILLAAELRETRNTVTELDGCLFR